MRQNFNNADEQCSQQDVVDFMNATQQFMDTTDWLERYGWFGAMEDMQGVNTVSWQAPIVFVLCSSCSSYVGECFDVFSGQDQLAR